MTTAAMRATYEATVGDEQSFLQHVLNIFCRGEKCALKGSPNAHMDELSQMMSCAGSRRARCGAWSGSRILCTALDSKKLATRTSPPHLHGCAVERCSCKRDQWSGMVPLHHW